MAINAYDYWMQCRPESYHETDIYFDNLFNDSRYVSAEIRKSKWQYPNRVFLKAFYDLLSIEGLLTAVYGYPRFGGYFGKYSKSHALHNPMHLHSLMGLGIYLGKVNGVTIPLKLQQAQKLSDKEDFIYGSFFRISKGKPVIRPWEEILSSKYTNYYGERVNSNLPILKPDNATISLVSGLEQIGLITDEISNSTNTVSQLKIEQEFQSLFYQFAEIDLEPLFSHPLERARTYFPALWFAVRHLPSIAQA